MKRNRRFCDYTSGLVGVYTLRPKATPGAAASGYGYHARQPEREEKDFYHSALIPCSAFLQAFEDPVRFSTVLKSKGESVLAEWPILNKGLSPPDRVMSERYFTLYQHTFQGDRFNVDIAEYEMQISTWSYTKKAQLVPTPEPLSLMDLKVGFNFFLRTKQQIIFFKFFLAVSTEA